jgi:SAM-dependent methyltransferase
MTQPERILLRRQIVALAPQLTGTVLDVGAGGHRYQYLFPAYKSLDVSGEQDILASATAIPLPDNSVDSILCAQVICELADPSLALREMHRVLKPNGKMILTAPQSFPFTKYDYCHFSSLSLQEMCRSVGFVQVEALPRGGYHSLMCNLRIRRWIDRWQPHKNPLADMLLSPLSALYTHFVLWFDRPDSYTLGWTILLQK